jgi:putative membrane protein
MSRLLIRLGINAVALYVAIFLVPGLQAQGEGLVSLLWLALIFGLVNALLRPLLKFLTCPLILLTLGLFTLVLNTGLFWLSGWIGTQFGVGFTVENFWAAFLGSIIVSVVSVVLSLVLRDELEGDRRRRRRKKD